jgi:23S rRNA (adenine2030-N6)-methyltransferase
VRVRTVDGFGYVATVSPDPAASTLVLIDPPYEAGDDYDRVVETVERVLARMPDAVVAIWAPIKDLETLDFLLRRLEAIPDARGYVAQLRLRPLVNPMRMNGCAMIVLGAAETAAAALATTAQLVRLCGETGAQAVVHPLGG